MKKLNKKNCSIIAIIVGCLFLMVYLFCYFFNCLPQVKFVGLLFWIILFLYIFLTTYWLYKKKWRNVLGISTKDISLKIIFKSLGCGLLASILINSLFIVILLVFNIPVTDSFGGKMTLLELVFGAIIFAPITEEILFRGFIQGLLENNHAIHRNKLNIKAIIVITALLFTVSHVRFIVYNEPAQWMLSLIGIFIIGLYFGHLRNKYQSIIPSMFAHLGYNISMFLLIPIILIIISIFQPDGWGKIKQRMIQIEFKNDSIYNFDPNDHSELFKSERKFLAFHNVPHPELKEYIVNGRDALVYIYYDIDTNGISSNIRLDSTKLSDFTGRKVAEEAFHLVKDFPPHKPYIEDGKKTKKTMSTIIPIYY